MSTITEKIIVSGPQPVSQDALPVRMEIHDLLKNAELKNLYLLGLAEMQSLDWEKERLSWYQVAGIHGGPYEPWDGEVDSKFHEKRGRYCTHSSLLFLPWHRPYLALFEQSLHNCIQEVLERDFTTERKEELKQIADDFRIPYWDWALYPSIPSELNVEKIDVFKGDGSTPTEIDNPLFSYKYPDRKSKPEGHPNHPHSDGGYPLSEWKPNAETSRDASNLEDELLAGAQWDKHYGANQNIRDRTFTLLSLVQYKGETFASFSTNKRVNNNKSSDYDSIESVHDWLHGSIGGGSGDMGDPAYAAFDPIFMMHHTNVDRLTALWQALHPNLDKSWETFKGLSSTFWTQNVDEGPQTNLIPFHKTADTYWNSIDCRDFTVFGSTYPELTDWKSAPSREALRQSVAERVRILYGRKSSTGQLSLALSAPDGPDKLLKKLATAPPHIVADSAESTNLVAPDSAAVTVTIPEPLAELAAQPTHSEYFTNLRAPKYAFGGSYAVHVFLGPVTTDAQNRKSDPNLVGTWAVFATNVEINGGCANCNDSAANKLVVTGSVPLTGALIERGIFDDSEAIAYLKENLSWSLHKSNGQELPLTNLVGMLKVFVTRAMVTKPTDVTGLPVYGDWNPVPEITADKITGTGFDPEETEGYVPTV